jgi:hypothetical protein
MSQPAPTFNQIRAKVLAVRRMMKRNNLPPPRFVGIHSPTSYDGERIRQDGQDTYRIEQCDSPLAARIALLDEEPGATVTVLVTALWEQDLGDDVRFRLGGRKLYEINPWEIVKELFQAQAIDPRLRVHNWIADRLLDLAPAAGLTPTPGGYLDAEAVWPLLLQRMIGLEGERPDLSLLLKWSSVAENVLRFRRLPEETRRAVEHWLAGGSARRQRRSSAVPGRRTSPTPCRWAWSWASCITHRRTGGWTVPPVGWSGSWAGRRPTLPSWNAGTRPPPRRSACWTVTRERETSYCTGPTRCFARSRRKSSPTSAMSCLVASIRGWPDWGACSSRRPTAVRRERRR